MECKEALEKILPAFEQYYTVIKNCAEPPFSAEALFSSFGEQYFLVKEFKLSEIDSHEHIYFLCQKNLTSQNLENYSTLAWEKGLASVTPYYGHRNSDITLIIIADTFDDDVLKTAKKIRFSKSYKFTLFGWSNFKLAAYEISGKRTAFNRLGKDFIRIFKNIKN